MTTLDRVLPQALLAVSCGLLLWGLLGLAEYVAPSLGFGLQDEAFPDGLQFLHFFAIAVTGAVFGVGYLARWPATRHATITMYAVLAAICFVETIDFGAFGGGAMAVMIMLGEFVLYAALSTYLLRSDAMRRRFAEADPGAGA
ncbi:MAG: hypothetical protein AAF676_06145 [Pseudomonadota bacterium]